jgi:DNA-binding GntR family transcriptional regulator
MAGDATRKLEQYLANQPNFNNGDALLSDVAYARLLDAFRHGGFRAEDTFSRNRVAEAMGISRTPVAQAIQRLAQEGMVRIVPGLAFAIAAPTLRETLDALEIRQRLEPWMTGLVAGRLKSAVQERLQATLDEMERAALADDRPAWSRADTVYHELVIAACPNRLLGDFVFQARNRILRTITDEYATRQYIIDGTAEHRAIAKAIIQGDAAQAETLVAEHIQNVRASILKRVL